MSMSSKVDVDLLRDDSAETHNLVHDIKRFRDDPLKFLSTLGHHAVGSSWRSYEDVVGQPLYYPGFSEQIKEKVMKNRRVQKNIRLLVQRQMESEESWRLTQNERIARAAMYRDWISNQTENMVSKLMVTFEHRSYLQACYYFFAQFLSRAYNQGVHVRKDEIDRLKKMAVQLRKKKQSMIFLPCHKSHIDYIAIQFICFRFGISLPAVVAGDNLNFAVVGPILQQVGAMFIRRGNWSDDFMYPAVAESYIETLLTSGYNFECFIEGTRSRTGKLLPPKFGILKYILDAIISGAVSDTYIVPISTQYDKVAEGNAYATELLGQDKKKESFWSFLESRNLVSLKMGRVDVRFDEPWSLREFVANQLRQMRVVTDTTTPIYVSLPTLEANQNASRPYESFHISNDVRNRLLRIFGYRVLRDINRLSEVMPTSLVGTVLLTWSGRGISRSQLIRRVQFLIVKVENAGGKVNTASHKTVEQLVDDALKVLGPSLVREVTERNSLLETVYYPNDEFKLSYYRNQVIHLFVDEAITCIALFTELRQEQRLLMDKEPIVSHTAFLSNLLSGEFVFDDTGLRVSLDHALSKLQQEEVLIDTHEKDKVQLSSVEFDKGSENFDFYCYLLWPFVDGYWCASVALFMLVEPIPERAFIKRAQSLAKTLYHQGEISYYEAVNTEMLKKAVEHFVVQGLLLRKPTTSPKVFTLEISAEWIPIKEGGHFVPDGRLYEYSEEIAKSRNKPLRHGLTAALTPKLLELCNTVAIGHSSRL